MGFKQFLERFIHIPCQILRNGHRLIYCTIQFTTDTLTLVQAFKHLKTLRSP